MEITTIILGFITLGLLVACMYLLKTKIEAEKQSKVREEQVKKQVEAARKDAKKRSGAIQWGKSIEHFIPFTEKFPVPPEDCTFLGMPIDFVAFSNTGSKTKCKVHFVEVKSGNAFLMGKQKNIKNAIENGRVEWHEISIAGNTVK